MALVGLGESRDVIFEYDGEGPEGRGAQNMAVSISHLSLTILGTTVRTEIPDDLKTSGEERF